MRRRQAASAALRSNLALQAAVRQALADVEAEQQQLRARALALQLATPLYDPGLPRVPAQRPYDRPPPEGTDERQAQTGGRPLAIQRRKWAPREDAALAAAADSEAEAEAAAPRGRSAAEARLRWRNWLRPGLDRDATALEAMRRAAPRPTTHAWGAAETRQLVDAVALFGPHNWPLVASLLPGRTAQQAANRWEKSANPALRKGRFTVPEDRRTRLAVDAAGGDWQAAARAVGGGRSATAVRERYNEALRPPPAAWTADEDALLEAGVEAFGLKARWDEVSTMVGSRRDAEDCWRRYRERHPEAQLVGRSKRNAVLAVGGQSRESRRRDGTARKRRRRY